MDPTRNRAGLDHHQAWRVFSEDRFQVTPVGRHRPEIGRVRFGLLSRGVSFPHRYIAEFCPWFEKSVRSARGFELRPSPRLFKSHLTYAQIPKGQGKYVYVA